MKKFKYIALILFIAGCCNSISAQVSTIEEEADGWYESVDGLSMQEAIRATEKHGVHWCAMPFVSYSEQLGMSGKLTGTVFDFGKNRFPNYDQMLYAEMGYSSHKAGTFRLYYDTKNIAEDYKFDFDIAYQPDALYDFYGFNGYAADYNYDFIRPFYNENLYEHDNPNYIGSAFYKMKRNLFRIAGDMRGILNDTLGLFWHVGVGVNHYSIGRVDVEKYNRGKAPMDQIEDTVTLYDVYRQWGLINDDEAYGAWHTNIHAGVSIDNRDREINPSRGFYGDAFFSCALAGGTASDYNNIKFNFNWKHHVSLWENVVTLAYMVGGQLTLVGESPFYQNGTINQLLSQRDMFDGTGGANLPRGMLRNRVLGKGYNYASVELRTNIFHCMVGKERVVISLNPFVDEMMLMQAYDLKGLDKGIITGVYFNNNTSVYMPHISFGCGAKVTVNNTFVVSCDWATPLKEQDNDNILNLYFNLGYLF